MIIKILGTGCPNCQKVEALARQAAEELNIQPTFEKVTEINKIVEYGIARTPGLVINDKVVSSGRIPAVSQIKTWIQEAE
jgi:small redox-active disulfide protein 2